MTINIASHWLHTHTSLLQVQISLILTSDNSHIFLYTSVPQIAFLSPTAEVGLVPFHLICMIQNPKFTLNPPNYLLNSSLDLPMVAVVFNLWNRSSIIHQHCHHNILQNMTHVYQHRVKEVTSQWIQKETC